MSQREAPLRFEGQHLVCPVCFAGYHHMFALKVGKDQERPDEIISVWIAIEGECGHIWTLVLDQRKGIIGAYATVAGEKPQ